jgi:hypothetical protein
MLEAQKAKDLADHYKRSDTNQLLNIEATRQSAKEGHLTQVQVANIHAAATRAGHPSETKQLTDEYVARVKKDGQPAADAWLKSIEKVMGVTKGYNVRQEGVDARRDEAVRKALENNSDYGRITRAISQMEAKKLKEGKLSPADQRVLDTARQREQEVYNHWYNRIHKEAPPTGGAGAGAPTGATPMPQSQAELQNGTVYQTSRGPARWDATKKQFFPV